MLFARHIYRCRAFSVNAPWDNAYLEIDHKYCQKDRHSEICILHWFLKSFTQDVFSYKIMQMQWQSYDFIYSFTCLNVHLHLQILLLYNAISYFLRGTLIHVIRFNPVFPTHRCLSLLVNEYNNATLNNRFLFNSAT